MQILQDKEKHGHSHKNVKDFFRHEKKKEKKKKKKKTTECSHER